MSSEQPVSSITSAVTGNAGGSTVMTRAVRACVAPEKVTEHRLVDIVFAGFGTNSASSEWKSEICCLVRHGLGAISLSSSSSPLDSHFRPPAHCRRRRQAPRRFPTTSKRRAQDPLGVLPLVSFSAACPYVANRRFRFPSTSESTTE